MARGELLLTALLLLLVTVTVTDAAVARKKKPIMPLVEREESEEDAPFHRRGGGGGGGGSNRGLGPSTGEPGGPGAAMSVDTLFRIAALVGFGDGSAALERKRREAGMAGPKAQRIFHPSVQHHPLPEDTEGADTSATAGLPVSEMPEYIKPFFHPGEHPVGEHPRDVLRAPGVGQGHRRASHEHYALVRLNGITESGTAPHLREAQRIREQEATKRTRSLARRAQRNDPDGVPSDSEARARRNRMIRQRRTAAAQLRRYGRGENLRVA